MINEIKIYDGKGNLKEQISPEKARKLYNEQNKENWCLSPTERQWWNGFKLEDIVRPTNKGRQSWIKRTYKKQLPKHKSICIICGKETIKISPDAKYCGTYCYGVSRRTKAKKQYHKSMGHNSSTT